LYSFFFDFSIGSNYAQQLVTTGKPTKRAITVTTKATHEQITEQPTSEQYCRRPNSFCCIMRDSV